MARQVAHKGEEYAYCTGTAVQEFQPSTQSEASIHKYEMNDLRDDLNWMGKQVRSIGKRSLLRYDESRNMRCCTFIYRHGQTRWRIIFPLSFRTYWEGLKV